VEKKEILNTKLPKTIFLLSGFNEIY